MRMFFFSSLYFFFLFLFHYSSNAMYFKWNACFEFKVVTHLDFMPKQKPTNLVLVISFDWKFQLNVWVSRIFCVSNLMVNHDWRWRFWFQDKLFANESLFGQFGFVDFITIEYIYSRKKKNKLMNKLMVR